MSEENMTEEKATVDAQGIPYPPKRPVPTMTEVMAEVVKVSDQLRAKLNLAPGAVKKVVVVPYLPDHQDLVTFTDQLKTDLGVEEVEVTEVDDDRFTYDMSLNKQAMLDRGKKSQLETIEADFQDLKDIFVKSMWETLNEQSYVEFNDITLEVEDVNLSVVPQNMTGIESTHVGVYFEV